MGARSNPQILQIPPSALTPSASGIDRALQTVRSHLGMDVAFVSEFDGDRRRFRYVDAKGRSPIQVGDTAPWVGSYSQKVIEGWLPELIADTAAVPEAAAIAETQSIPIGSHLSVPLRLADGRIYGTFTCFSYQADRSLNERDLNMMKAFADLVIYHIEADLETEKQQDAKAERIRTTLRSREPSLVYQPVFKLDDMTVTGAESLSRFRSEPVRSPDVWFAEAAEVGLRTDLELKTMRKALAEFQPVWKRAELYLGLNSSPQTIIEGDLARVFYGLPADRIILEITEHDHVEDYDALRRALKPLRAQGVMIAIDDAGSGYASMRHILNIEPDVIKLDNSLTRRIDADGMRRALASALIAFGRQTNCRIVAEGVETSAELRTLRDLGVHAAQGFHLGRPMPLESYRRLVRHDRERSRFVGREEEAIGVLGHA